MAIIDIPVIVHPEFPGFELLVCNIYRVKIITCHPVLRYQSSIAVFVCCVKDVVFGQSTIKIEYGDCGGNAIVIEAVNVKQIFDIGLCNQCVVKI